MAAPQLVCVCARARPHAPPQTSARASAGGRRGGARGIGLPTASESIRVMPPSRPRHLILATSPHPRHVPSSPPRPLVPPRPLIPTTSPLAGRTRTRMPGWSRRGPPGCSSSTCGAAETPPHVPASRPRLTSPPHVPSSRTLLTSPSHVPFTRPLPPQLVDVRCGGGGAPARAARSVFETVFERARSRFETFLKGFESPRTVWGVSQALGRR